MNVAIKVLIVGGVIVFIILRYINGLSNNLAETISSNNQPSLCNDIASLKNQATTVNFKELDKNPESFKDKIAKFTGQVLQIQEADNYGMIRLAVTKESYGWSIGDIIYVEYQNHADAVQDDVVTVYGQLTGSKTYESQAHFNITVPSMTACIVEKVETEKSINSSIKVTTPAPAKIKVKSTPVATQTPIPTLIPTPSHLPIKATRVDGLATIYISGGIWENWDADMENDGPFLEIVYKDGLGDIITDDSTEEMPISADVKLYTEVRQGYQEVKDRVVFSAHYTDKQIIFDSFHPKIRIPKEQISSDPSKDYRFGIAEVTIYTPEQGTFSAVGSFVTLFEE